MNESSRETSILDLSIDSLVQCASSLCPRDLASMAMASKHLRQAVYCDAIWEIQCRKRWPPKEVFGTTFQFCGGKKLYEERFKASQKCQFLDPFDLRLEDSRTRVYDIQMEGSQLYVNQGHRIRAYDMEPLVTDMEPLATFLDYDGHYAQVTCMRLVPSTALLPLRNISDGTDPVLITSSMDHTIRLWRKGRSLRTLRGHSGPVTTLSKSLLGCNTLASGGMDGTIKLWTLSGQKRGSSPLLNKFHGHELAVKQLVVTEYNPSLLISGGRDLKVRVWDITSTSTGALVGSKKILGALAGLSCKGYTCYVAGGSELVLIDIRSLRTTMKIEAHKPRILDFSIPASGDKVCTGGTDKSAKLWDLRNVHEPYATLGGHKGDVNLVHMDSYKAVTGGFDDDEVYVWDSETGDQVNSIDLPDSGLTALKVQGARIATGLSTGSIQFRDYSNCAVPIRQAPAAAGDSHEDRFKFWETSFMEV